MQEIFPFMAGMVIGVLIQNIRTPKLKMIVFVALCLIFGAIASYISGELAVSWGFLTFDAALVWLGATLSVGLLVSWRRWSRSLTGHRM